MSIEKTRISRHFTFAEAACKCGCGYARINDVLVHRLERLRALAGHNSLIVNSWCRCEKHNKAVGGAPASQHLFGVAADVRIPGLSPAKVAALAEQAGFDGIGVYSTFTHVDIRGHRVNWEG